MYLTVATPYHSSTLQVKDQKRSANEPLYFLSTFKFVDVEEPRLTTEKTKNYLLLTFFLIYYQN